MLLPYLQKATEGRDFAAVHPVSALKRKGLEALVAALLALVPEQPPLYGEDEITDKSQRLIPRALVREQHTPHPAAHPPYAPTLKLASFTLHRTHPRTAPW